MTEIDDNTDDIALSAYIDGELPDADARALKERLLKEPALARRLKVLRGADSDALRLYSAIDKRPMPQGVLDLLDRAPKSSNVITFPKRAIPAIPPDARRDCRQRRAAGRIPGRRAVS